MNDLRRIIWLASFPKSGNTWMRLLLAHYFMPDAGIDINSIHKFTTSDVRQDIFDRVAGKPFRPTSMEEWLQMRAKVLPAIAASKQGHHFVKTHSMVGQIGPWHLIMPEVTAAAVYVIRNPFDVLPSYARHLSIDLDQALEVMQSEEHVNSTAHGLAEKIGSWDRNVQSWVDAPGLPLHILRYEDLLSDTEGELRRLLGFLKAPVRDGILRKAIRKTSFKSLQQQESQKGFRERPENMKQFFSTGTSGGWRQVLSPTQVQTIRSAFLPMLMRFYPEILDETENFGQRAS